MSVNLQKGQKVSLTKGNAGLSRVIVGLGWDEAQQKRGLFAPKPQAIDCDASALVLRGGRLI
ncbi:MAG: TerD family protein, partial [Ruminococcus sp.]|nr:TerD family protein [Ruminococcus sp.]